jgi:signal transduction histidine kinase
VLRYTDELDRSRDLFLAVLGHDVRTPLGAAMASAESLRRRDHAAARSPDTADRLTRSLQRVASILGNLQDFTRGRLGVPVPVIPAKANMGAIFQQALDEVRTTHPTQAFVTDMSGDLDGEWDALRLSQLASNLISNAVQHGAASAPIHVRVHSAGDMVHAEVHNGGPAIPESQARRIFDPLVRGSTEHAQGMGLGLYIARQIALAHGGAISLDKPSSAGGTTFRIAIPRSRGADAGQSPQPAPSTT